MQLIYDDYKQIHNILNEMGSKKPYFICGKYLLDSFAFDYIKKEGISYTIYTDFKPNPLYEDVVNGLKKFKENECDSIVAIGGGSAIDVAKAIKLFVGLDDNKCYLEQEYKNNSIPFLAIPTTAGTGSESTRFAVIYYNGVKQSLNSDNIIPKYVILEEKFLETLPLYQKKSTMLDALCQAIESYWSVNSNDESKMYSKKAIKMILDNMDNYIQNNGSLKEMMIASNLAGRAINITQTTAAHAMSYKITSLYGISHGHAVAICLPYVWEYMINNLDKCVDKRGKEYLLNVLEELSIMLNSDSIDCVIDKLISIYLKINLKCTSIVKKEDVELLVSSVNPTRLKNNPVNLDKDGIEKIYRRLV